MAKQDHLTKYNELLNPLLQALHDLGGFYMIDEISSRVSESHLCHIHGIKGATMHLQLEFAKLQFREQ